MIYQCNRCYKDIDTKEEYKYRLSFQNLGRKDDGRIGLVTKKLIICHKCKNDLLDYLNRKAL